jgi:signal transduction histidine kinase/CheY-like chemotaxis protein
VSSEPRAAGLLARRYFRQLAGLSVGLLLAAGTLEALFGYQEARASLARVQGLQAQAATAEIEQYLKTIERTLQAVQALPWGQADFGAAQRREELHRLLALSPSLVELLDVDSAGQELLAVSRLTPDRMATLRQLGVLPLGYAAPQFDDTGVPHVQLALARSGAPAGQTLARINLRFLADVVSGLRLADGGEVYVVDGRDQLIAHADPTQLLRQRSLGSLGVIQAARAVAADHATPVQAFDAPGLLGREAVSTGARLSATGWLVIVEHPRAQAMQPVIATLQRTLWLLALAAVLATLASAAFSRRMAAPIARLRSATASMAAGQWAQRLKVESGDEIGGLAADFNTMSARLQQSYAELENKVIERTAELAQRREEAERANAAKTRFLAAASHDLRQPMHAIGLMVGLLRQRAVETEQRVLADRTHAAVRSMETLFGSLLDVSKLDAGAVVPQRSDLALQDLLDRVQRAYTPLAAAKGLELRVRPTPWAVHSDPALLERILGNLVSNAIRYTRSGGVLVAVRQRGATGVQLQVTDSGIGIAPGQMEMVFEEFVRLGEQGGGEEGLGLGLSIVRRTAALLGHTVGLRSHPGQGSTFTVQLPLAKRPLQGSPQADLGNTLAGLQGAFVLVVDDDARNQEATAALLAQHGCLVAQAGNAESALAEAANHLRVPDVLITDLRLGVGRDGLALIRALRQQTETWVPALLVTAETSLPAELDGDVHVLLKPAGPDALLQAVVRALAPLSADAAQASAIS